MKIYKNNKIKNIHRNFINIYKGRGGLIKWLARTKKKRVYMLSNLIQAYNYSKLVYKNVLNSFMLKCEAWCHLLPTFEKSLNISE